MKALLLVVSSLVLASPAIAQEIVVEVSGSTITCSTLQNTNGFDVNYFSLGGMNQQTPVGTGAPSGRVILGPLVVHKQFDACSEQLLKEFLSLFSLKTVTLKEYTSVQSANGPSHFPILTITLSNATITNYQVTNTDTIKSNEVLNFSYQNVCIASTAVTVSGGQGTTTTVCYNTRNGQVT